MPDTHVGYITPEIALDPKLRLYAGGLGYLAGSHSRSAFRAQKPLTCFSLLYRCGYYRQEISSHVEVEGRRKRYSMTARWEENRYENILEHTNMRIRIPLCGNPAVYANVMRLPKGIFGGSETYLLDADIPENDDLSRTNTMYLYGGRANGSTLERVIAQSMILGRGAIEAAHALNIPITVWHLNESYTAFAAMHLIELHMQKGMTFEEALESVRACIIFTTHTPVPDGNPRYDVYKISEMWGQHPNRKLTQDHFAQLGGDPKFNMTAACIRMSRITSAVSKRHFQTAQKMWQGVLRDEKDLTHVTNGVDRIYWQKKEFSEACSPEDMHGAKILYKRAMLDMIAKSCDKRLSENICTVVWARRFAEYKRPKLLFYDYPWISNLLAHNRLQIVVAGKPHPDDLCMIDAWNDILRISHELPNVVVIPEYDLAVSQALKAGADVWLNTPRAPNEACGTSGMGAALNGTLNMSTPDGWMCEANANNCFLFGSEGNRHITDQDTFDLEKLRGTLERVIGIYIGQKEKWNAKALAQKQEAEKHWTSDRMFSEYEQFYMQ